MAWIELKADVYSAFTTYTGPEPVQVNLDLVVDIRFGYHRASDSTLAIVGLITGETIETHDAEDVAALNRYVTLHHFERDGAAERPLPVGAAAVVAASPRRGRNLRRFLHGG
jgi:hypothetical protein